MQKPTILHICPHLGGGVGRFYKNIFSEDDFYIHRFALLEKPIDIQILPSEDSWFVISSQSQLYREIADALIVQIEFWNHPLLYSIFPKVKSWPCCRLVLYSHISGLYPPSYLPPEIANIPDILILATAAAKFTDAAHSRNKQTEIVPEFGGASRTQNVTKKQHQGFCATYIGTANPLKIHPDIIQWCSKIHRQNTDISFIFCTQDDSNYLQKQVPTDIKSAFRFLERVEDIGKILSTSDVFGYPLQPRHYGTGEQALLEAMGSGIPSVVLDNPAERYIIEHGYSGVIARSGQEYIDAVLLFASYPSLAIEMGKNAKKQVLTTMSPEVTRSKFYTIYEVLGQQEKTKHFMDIDLELTSWELFLLSQGEDSNFFKKIIESSQFHDKIDPFLRWQLSLKKNQNQLVPTKGTIAHWDKYFPSDENLSKLCSLMETV